MILIGARFMKNANRRQWLVRDRMIIDPATVGPGDRLQSVVNPLRRRDIRSLPVIDNGKVIETVTEPDIRQGAPAYPFLRDDDEIRRYSERLTVTAAMTADPMAIGPDQPVVDAAKILKTYRISSLPVVDKEKRLLRLLTVADLLRVFIEQNQEGVP